jgi:hypothetical protein
VVVAESSDSRITAFPIRKSNERVKGTAGSAGNQKSLVTRIKDDERRIGPGHYLTCCLYCTGKFDALLVCPPIDTTAGLEPLTPSGTATVTEYCPATPGVSTLDDTIAV